VEELNLVLPGGELVCCAPDRNRELFAATIGGMGLTGVIVEATFRLKTIETGWIMQRTTVAPDLESAMKALDVADHSTYSVAWIDCLARGSGLGRALVFSGEHAMKHQLPAHQAALRLLPQARPARLSVPFDLPSWTLNVATVAAFNAVYFRRGSIKARGSRLVHWNPYFFPLDGVDNWNRIYGQPGFLQHQAVIPEQNAAGVLREILDRLLHSHKAAFMAVLKKLGPGMGLLSFPMKGYTLALDFHVSDDIFPLLDGIDRLVVGAGGRLYLAKDARQSQQTFEAGYARLNEFRDVRRAVHADGRLASRLSIRLGI
jgi:FAD/FMN-containing dehydrogenase